MKAPSDPNAARWLPLLVVGISVNTVGISLSSAGPWRYVLMAAGILIMLVAITKMVSSRGQGKPQSGDDSSGDASNVQKH